MRWPAPRVFCVRAWQAEAVLRANTLEEHAKLIAKLIASMVLPLWGRHVEILRSLARLAAERRLVAVQ